MVIFKVLLNRRGFSGSVMMRFRLVLGMRTGVIFWGCYIEDIVGLWFFWVVFGKIYFDLSI